MAPELGGSKISALLESVPGIARVLRSPVADAIVNMIRAGAGLIPFRRADAEELVQFAMRRGLISTMEGEEILDDVGGKGQGPRKPSRASAKTTKKVAKKKATKRR